MYKLNIGFIVGGLPFNGETVSKKSLGGSESAAYYMALALHKLGHNVVVFTNTQDEGVFDGVKYINISKATQFSKLIPFDVLIGQRDPSMFSVHGRSKLNILWCHDLALNRLRGSVGGCAWNIDSIFVLSEFHKQQYKAVTQLPDDLFFQTRNGIDVEAIKKVIGVERNKKHLVYAARPERGLINLVYDIAPALFSHDKDIKIHITTYDNPVTSMESLYNKINAGIQRYPNNFIVESPMKKADLFALYKRCGAYVYPTEFEEISCISAMEAMACGLPFITSAVGALPETLHKDAAIILPADLKTGTKEYNNAFINAVLDTIGVKTEAWKKMSNAGSNHAKTLSWATVADEWTQRFTWMFREKTSNKEKLAKHFVWHSDIVAAEYLSEKDSPVQKQINALYPYKNDFEAYKKHYERISEGASWEVGRYAYGEPRLEVLKQFIASKKDKIKTVLDFGCAHGGYVVALSNAFPDIKFTGLDISQHLVDCGNELAKHDAKHKNNIKFIRGDEKTPLNETFDCVICCEVLEHVTEPWKVAEHVEKCAKVGGLVVGTVPFGMRDQEEVRLKGQVNPPVHLWELDLHDLNDMFGQKQKYSWHTVPSPQACLIDHSAQGWWFFSFLADHKDIPSVDMVRKTLIQSPTESVTACIIAKNSENLLLRCLKSVRPYVDEIVFVDTGSVDSTLSMARAYCDKVIEAPLDALKDGFDAVRNLSIEHATSDWILWIDTDEALQNPYNLRKYLRPNIFNGYGLKQHHFCCEPAGGIEPDLPVRLFRADKGIKFYGLVHEHPETAINSGVGQSIVLNDLHIAHDGYLTEGVRRGRFFRNINLMIRDREKYPERILGKILMMRDWMLLARYSMEQNGGAITEEAVGYCKNVVAYYHKYFAKSTIALKSGISPLVFYSEAVRLLGNGLEVSWQVSIKHNGLNIVNTSPQRSGCFEDTEDALSLIATDLKSFSEPLKGNYV